MNIQEFRQKYPSQKYEQMSDYELADTVYKKHYEGRIDRGEFFNKFQVEDSMPIGDVASGALRNLPGSTMKMGKDLWGAVSHPIDTATSMYELAKGAIQLAIPGEQGNEALARQVGKMYQERYGDWENAKRLISEDPATALSDLSLFISGGATAGAKAVQLGSKLGKPGTQMVRQGTQLPNLPTTKLGKLQSGLEKTAKYGNLVDPFALSAYGAGKMGSAAFGTLAPAVTGKLTGMGEDVVKQNFDAGLRTGVGFNKNPTPWQRGFQAADDADTLVRKAKSNLSDLSRQESAKYMKKLDEMGKNNQPIPWLPLQKKFYAIGKSMYDETGKIFQVADKAEIDKLGELVNVFEEFKRNPDKHTLIGFDELKKKLWKVKIPANMKDAKNVRKRLSGAVKGEIVNIYPAYQDMVGKYDEYLGLRADLEGAFGKGIKASDKHEALNTTLQKLQSAMRNQVNTGMGNKRKLLNKIDPTQELADQIAGQASRPIMPRGMMGSYGPATALGAGAIGGPAAGLGLLAAESPNLVGRVSHMAGRASAPVKATAEFLGPTGGHLAARGLIEADRMDEEVHNIRLEKKAPKSSRKKKKNKKN